MSSCDFLMALPIDYIGRYHSLCKALGRCPTRVIDVLDMAGGAAWSFNSCRTLVLLKDLGIMTMGAGCARIISIDIGAHVACLMTTAA